MPRADVTANFRKYEFPNLFFFKSSPVKNVEFGDDRYCTKSAMHFFHLYRYISDGDDRYSFKYYLSGAFARLHSNQNSTPFS